MRAQSSTVGRRSPAAWAIAGTWSTRLVDPPTAALQHHGVVDRVVGDDVHAWSPTSLEGHERVRGATGEVAPDLGARRAERAVREGEAERLRHHLARRGRAHELAAAAGGTAGAAAHLGGVIEAHLPARIARRRSLDLGGDPRPPPRGAWRLPARAPWGGRGCGRAPSAWPAGPCRRWRRRAPLGGWAAAYQPSDDGGVVAVSEAVEHADGAIGPPVARIADIAGDG